MGTESRFDSLRDLHAWCSAAPAGTRIDARELAALLSDLADHEGPQPFEPDPPPGPPETWRVRLWSCPAETRLSVAELTEALACPKSRVYMLTSSETIPFRKLDGALSFTAGEIRAWVRDREEAVVGGESWTPRIVKGDAA